MEVFSDEDKSEAEPSLMGDSEFDDEPKLEQSEQEVDARRETKTLNKGKDSSKSRR